MDAGEEQEAVKDYGSFKHPPVDEGDIAAHHTDRWQNQAMYVGLHFAHNPNRGKRRRHKHHRHKHRPDKPEAGAGEEHDSAKPPTPPSQRVQFLLGQDDQDEDHMSHDIFCEMEELRAVGEEGDVEWKETARWIKFEEDVEEGGERWSKPHVATLSLHSLFELRKGILSGTVMLDLDATNIMQITEMVLDNMLASKQLEPEHRERVQEVLLSRHRHQHEKEKKGLPIIRSLADIGKKHSSKGLEEKDGSKSSMSKKGSAKDLNDAHTTESGVDLSQTPSMTKKNKEKEPAFNYAQRRGSMFDRLLDLAVLPMQAANSSKDKDLTSSQPQFNEHFLKKIPQGAEASNVLVGEVEFLNHPIIAFVRLAKAQMLGDLTEVPVPTRFIFILLGPQGNQSRYHEIGRSIATLMSDEVFHDVAYKAKDRGDLLAGIDEFLDQVTVLPPGEWDPTIRIEPPKSVPSQEGRKHQAPAGGGLPNGAPAAGGDDGDGGEHHGEDHSDHTLVRTGKFFGGLRADLKRKIPFYLSDFRDVLHVQCIASIFFMYFACLTPIITFGGLLGAATDNNMAAIESLLAGAICGISYHLFAGQPLTIIGSTGPVLVFETIVFNFCNDYGFNYLSFRFWIGLWVSLALLIIVAFDLSALVRYITRFTEESFACLIALIFIYEAFKKLFHILDHDGVYRSYDPHHPPDYSCECVPHNASFYPADYDPTSNVTHPLLNIRDEEVCEDTFHGKLKGLGCNKIPDVFFFSCLLFTFTFVLSYWLKMFRNQRFFPAKVRGIISDFAVMIAIVSMVGADAGLGLHTPKLRVPEDFKPTNPDRPGWVINPFVNEWWCVFAAILPAMLATILIFMDQQITAVIVNRKENKLRKGAGYHLDLLLIAIQIGICSVLGIPWFVAATVLSINHVRSLTVESESAAPGEKPRFLGIREQRVTGIVVFLMCGISVCLTQVLKLIPMAVLYGVFLFMGVSSLNGVQLMQRISIVFMPPKYQPDYIYLRHVPLRRVHLFTAIQVLCLVILWVIKTIKSISIVFPLMVLAMCFVRKGLDWVFTRHELTWLDDIMPETHKKEKEEKKKKLMASEDTEPPEKKLSNAIEMTGGAINIPLKDGKSINIPVDRITYDPESNQVRISEEMGKTAIWKQLAANESNPDFQMRNRKPKKKHSDDKGDEDPGRPVKFSIEGASSDEHLDSPQIVIDPPSKAGTPDEKNPTETTVEVGSSGKDDVSEV